LVLPVTAANLIPILGSANSPTDPDLDGVYEDLNGNDRIDFNDVVVLFKTMEWIAQNEPISSFDFNGNGRIDFNDVVKLFEEVGSCIRLSTGTSLISETRHGSADLTIDNQNNYDAVVTLRIEAIPYEVGSKVLSFYLRTHDQFTVRNIETGRYTIWYKLGECWDPVNNTFQVDMGAWRFDDILDYSSDIAGYEVWIYGVEGGNATTTPVPADQI